jgi:hypothetical protein
MDHYRGEQILQKVLKKKASEKEMKLRLLRWSKER